MTAQFPAPAATTTQATDGGVAWPALDLGRLAGGRGGLPAFPLEILPPAWGVWAADQARGLGAPVDCVALALLGAVAGSCGAGVEVHLTPDWHEPLVLWQALVGPNALVVSEVLERLRRILGTIESRLRANGVLGGAPGDTGDDGLAGTIVADTPAMFTIARLVAANPRGVLLWRDQPTPWLAELGEAPADRARWRRAWSARALALPAERDGRATAAPGIVVDRFSVGILGTLEPEQLGQLDRADPGLAARFLYAWPAPAPAPFCPFAERRTSRADDSTRRLQEIEEQARRSDGPLVLTPEPPALAPLEAFLAQLHPVTEQADGLEAAWLSHGPANIARLAAALALLAWSEGPATRPPDGIDATAMTGAIGLWDGYLRPHALAVLERTLPGDLERRARRLVRWLRATGCTEVSGEKVRSAALARTVTAAQTAEILERVAEAGAVRRIEARTGRKGRPAERWAVNPALGSGIGFR